MATAPQYKLHRTVGWPVAFNNPYVEDLDIQAAWFGYNYPALTDAGDYILAWEGVTYDNNEDNDPFYWHVLKIKKSTFAVEGEFFVPLNGREPSFQYGYFPGGYFSGPAYTAAAIGLKGGKIYAMGWTWHSQKIRSATGPDDSPEIIGGPFGLYRMYVVDFETMEVESASSFVEIDGFESVLSSGGTERDATMFFHDDYVYVGAQAMGYLFRYTISSGILVAFPNGGFTLDAPRLFAAWAMDNNGVVYRLSQVSSISNPQIMRLEKATSLGGFDEVGAGIIEGYLFGSSNPNGNADLYLDNQTRMLYFEALDDLTFDTFWLQVSLDSGQLVRAIASPFLNFFGGTASSSQSSAIVDAPWSGFAPAVFDTFGPDPDDPDFVLDTPKFYFRDKDNNFTYEPNVFALYPDPSNVLIDGDSTPVDYPWDILFTKAGKPMYISVLTSDLFFDPDFGAMVPIFYEYITNPQMPFTQLIT